MSTPDYLQSLLNDFSDLETLLAEREAQRVPWRVEDAHIPRIPDANKKAPTPALPAATTRE